jgi:hypothetical protein
LGTRCLARHEPGKHAQEILFFVQDEACFPERKAKLGRLKSVLGQLGDVLLGISAEPGKEWALGHPPNRLLDKKQSTRPQHTVDLG